MTRAELIEKYARAAIGRPYIYGATGQTCTPAYREARCKQYPEYAATIRACCPVLAGARSSCAGCKYAGMPAYDCAQLVRLACKAGGYEMKSGATTQWKTTNFAQRGEFKDRPAGKLLVLYRKNGETMQHTGLLLPDGSTVDARGHKYGVVYSKDATAYKWTHYGLLPGIDENEGENMADLQPGEAVVTAKSGNWVNVRKSPGGAVLTRLQVGEPVEVLENKNGWAHVRYCADAYIMSEFLAGVRPDE